MSLPTGIKTKEKIIERNEAKLQRVDLFTEEENEHFFVNVGLVTYVTYRKTILLYYYISILLIETLY